MFSGIILASKCFGVSRHQSGGLIDRLPGHITVSRLLLTTWSWPSEVD